MKPYNISIPTPCLKDWNSMTTVNNGKHCTFCNKVVIDFTKMNNEEIKNYFSNFSDRKICGHFLNSQIDNNKNSYSSFLKDSKLKFQNIKFSPLRYISIFLLGFLITLSGCYQSTIGEIIESDDSSDKNGLTGDTIVISNKILKDTSN